jgi:hypothetical protein
MSATLIETAAHYTVYHESARLIGELPSITARSALSPLRLTIDYPLGNPGQGKDEPRYCLRWGTERTPNEVAHLMGIFGSQLPDATFGALRLDGSETQRTRRAPQDRLPDDISEDTWLMYACSEPTNQAVSWMRLPGPDRQNTLGTLALCSDRPFSDPDILDLVMQTSTPSDRPDIIASSLGVLDAITRTYMWATPAVRRVQLPPSPYGRPPINPNAF